MSDQSVTMVVAGYCSAVSAQRDFLTLRRVKHRNERDGVAAAIVEKGADGRLTLAGHDNGAQQLARGDALLAGALSVVAAPLGILFLGTVLLTRTALAGAGAVAGHFWHRIPKHQLRLMTDLVEAGQAALVIVAVGATGEELARVLSNATAMVIADGTTADFEAYVSNAIEEANAMA